MRHQIRRSTLERLGCILLLLLHFICCSKAQDPACLDSTVVVYFDAPVPSPNYQYFSDKLSITVPSVIIKQKLENGTETVSTCPNAAG
jgi:hypothetical protein